MRIPFIFIELIALTLALGSPHNVSSHKTNNRTGYRHAPGELIWEDNFDSFDFDSWQHEITMSGGGNWEFQIYHNSRENSYVQDGNLFITPTLTSDRHGEEFLHTGTLNLHGGAPADECTNPSYYGCERVGQGQNIINPIMSARIRTVNAFSFKYGKVEVRAKIPSGDWLWPAVWLLPRRNAYGPWPASGEIDIMESRGNRKLLDPQGINIGTEQVSQTMHYGPYFPLNGYEKTHYVVQRPVDDGFDRAFHVYGIEWTSEGLIYTVDGAVTGTVVPPEGGFWELGEFPSDVKNPWTGGEKMAPFDQEFYIIINLAVGGTNGFFPDDSTGPYPKPWSNTSPIAMYEFWNGRSNWLPTWGPEASFQVDYVRVFEV